jgi:hypothetical protein
MVRSTLAKVMWVGKATVFMIGLAMIMALVLGVATAALGTTGANFILGKVNNTAETPTGLVSTLADATKSALIVTNKSGGAALELRVGNASTPANDISPMKVNSNKVVTNLNADTLDGKNSSDFAAAYKRTVVVSPVGTPTQNGTALLDAIAGTTDASATKPYLIHIEPATYDLGNGSLSMKQWVDVEGSGELNTIITSGVDGGLCGNQLGTVNGADNAEMRFLTVRNTGRFCSTTISNNSASPRLTHLTAETTGESAPGSLRAAVFNNNSSPTMTDVTATASGGSFVYAVFDNGSNPTMTDVTATASGGTSANYGVWNQTGSSPTIRQSKLSGSTFSLAQTDGGSAKVALSQLVGGVGGGPVQCFNNYNENMAAVSCP